MSRSIEFSDFSAVQTGPAYAEYSKATFYNIALMNPSLPRKRCAIPGVSKPIIGTRS
jgi:hypothetical protein